MIETNLDGIKNVLMEKCAHDPLAQALLKQGTFSLKAQVVVDFPKELALFHDVLERNVIPATQAWDQVDVHITYSGGKA